MALLLLLAPRLDLMTHLSLNPPPLVGGKVWLVFLLAVFLLVCFCDCLISVVDWGGGGLGMDFSANQKASSKILCCCFEGCSNDFSN